jgi:hypothetical protein
MRPTGVRILGRSSLRNYPRPGGSLSWVTLTSPAHNKSIASRRIAPLPLSGPGRSENIRQISSQTSFGLTAGILPGSSRQQAGVSEALALLSLFESHPRATGSVSITVHVTGETG